MARFSRHNRSRRIAIASVAFEARYKTAVDPIGKSHFHALWLRRSCA